LDVLVEVQPRPGRLRPRDAVRGVRVHGDLHRLERRAQTGLRRDREGLGRVRVDRLRHAYGAQGRSRGRQGEDDGDPSLDSHIYLLWFSQASEADWPPLPQPAPDAKVAAPIACHAQGVHAPVDPPVRRGRPTGLDDEGRSAEPPGSSRTLPTRMTAAVTAAPCDDSRVAHGDRLSGLDTSFLQLERGPTHMHVASTTLFEGPAPAYEEFRDQIAS